jgi:HTH-type transcriptional regulator/antitoxin HigA
MIGAAMKAIDDTLYANLLTKTLPHVIETEEENEQYLAALEELDERDDLTPEEDRLAKLLTLLIQDFEDRYYHKMKATPLEVVRLLMDSNDLRPADMTKIFGSKGITSEVLHGKRPFSKTHIRRLSERFHVSPELFLEAK